MSRRPCRKNHNHLHREQPISQYWQRDDHSSSKLRRHPDSEYCTPPVGDCQLFHHPKPCHTVYLESLSI